MDDLRVSRGRFRPPAKHLFLVIELVDAMTSSNNNDYVIILPQKVETTFDYLSNNRVLNKKLRLRVFSIE